MKQKSIIRILLAVIVGCVLGWLTYAMGADRLCKPFAAVGQWLRSLSLRGGIGNAVAWAVSLTVSGLPLLLLLKRRGTYNIKDVLLPIASAELFFLIYYLVNPTRLSEHLLWMDQAGIRNHWTLICGGAFLVTVLSWLILTYLDRIEGSEGQFLPKLLIACSFLLAFFGGFQGMRELLTELSAVRDGNTDIEIVRTAGFFKAVILLVRLIPTVISSGVLLWGRDLAYAVEEDPFGQTVVSLSKTIAYRCKAVVKFTVLCALAANLLQLMFLPRLADIRIRVEFPLVTLALTGALFLLCGYFRRAKELHDDNASII